MRPERPFDGAQGRPERVEGRGAKPPGESEWGWGPTSAKEEGGKTKASSAFILPLLPLFRTPL